MIKQRSPFSIFAGFTLAVLGGMIFNVGGLFAGRSAVLLNDLEGFLKWVFLIYPLLLTVRGDINGILSGKLGTALHLGTIKPSWRKNTSRFYELMGLVFFFSIFDAIIVSITATILSVILGISAKFLDILVISVTTFALGAIVSMVFTFTLTFWIYNRKGDPDVYVYPIMSSINDILITVIFFGACQLYRPWKTNLHLYLGLPIIVIIFTGIVFYFVKFGKRDYVSSSIKQSLPTLTITNLIASGTGTMLASIQLMLVQFPIFLVVYPAMISTVGGQGSILANTTSTKLHLGTIKPSFTFFKSKNFLSSFGSIFTAGLLLNFLYSILGTLLSPDGISFSKYGVFLLILTLSNIIGFLIIGILATSSAFITYRFGLDPDNLVNPILSSCADLVTTGLLALSFLIFI
ncbi:MAG: magnesium transporter [Candidatus Heimdallarchaeaceae archaeon]